MTKMATMPNACNMQSNGPTIDLSFDILASMPTYASRINLLENIFENNAKRIPRQARRLNFFTYSKVRYNSLQKAYNKGTDQSAPLLFANPQSFLRSRPIQLLMVRGVVHSHMQYK